MSNITISPRIMKGYMGSRPFFGVQYPHRVQNLMIREYAERNHFQYGMSDTELSIEHSAYILLDVLKKQNSYQAIGFFSVFLLPQDPKTRAQVYHLLSHNIELHFVLEQQRMTHTNDIDYIEDILSIKTHIEQTPLPDRYSANMCTSYAWKNFSEYLYLDGIY